MAVAPSSLPGRWVPPAYTPIPLGGLAEAGAAALLRRDDRGRLVALLAGTYAADTVVLTDSGTGALQLAMRAFASDDTTRRPRIALPAFACFDLVTAAVGADATPVFYDVVPETLEPEWSSFESALAARVDAVVVAPLFGLPGGWPKVRALAEAAGVPIIEDAAQGFGSSPGGRRAGSLGDVSVLSFGRGKGWTGGGGGALLGRSEERTPPTESAAVPGAIGVLGRSLVQCILSSPSLYGVPARIPALGLGETRYRPPRAVESLAPASATLLLASRAAAEREAEGRRRRARRLVEGVDGGYPGRWSAVAGYLRLPVLLPTPGKAEALSLEYGRRGVQRSYPAPLPTLPPLAGRMETMGECPGAAALADRLVTLPTHSGASDEDIRRLVAATRAAGGQIVGPDAG